MPIIYTPTRRPRVPEVRPHLPAAARHLHQRQRPRPHRAECCATGRIATRRSSSSPTASASWAWATSAPTAWASRSASSSLYTACAGVHPDAVPAGHARRRHQQRRRCSTTRSTSACASAALTGARLRRAGRGIRHRGARGLSRRRRSSSRTSPTTTRSACCEKYRDRICTFNDDIQGTAAVALAGPVLGAAHHRRHARPTRQLLFLGAGEAATGIADLVVAAMVAQGADRGRRRGSAAGSSTRRGLVVEAAHRSRRAQAAVRARARAGRRFSSPRSRRCKPTAIIGVAAVGGAFTRDVLEDDGARSTSGRSCSRCRIRRRSPSARAEQAYRVDRRPRAVRVRQPVRSGDARTARPSCRGRATTPTSSPASASARSSSRARRITDEMFMAAAHDARRTGDRSRPGAGQPLSAAAADPRGVGEASPWRSPRSPSAKATPASSGPPDLLAHVQLAHVRPDVSAVRLTHRGGEHDVPGAHPRARRAGRRFRRRDALGRRVRARAATRRRFRASARSAWARR